MSKVKPEFEYLTLDTMEIVTRGVGIKFEPDTATIEKLNSLANSETSKIFCPSYTKTKAKRRQGRPKKQLPDISEGVRDINNLPQYEQITEVDRQMLTTPIKQPTPMSPGPTLGELLQSAPVLGKKRLNHT